MNDDISKEYLKEHIKACWINGRPKYSPELHEVLSWIDDVPSAEPEIKERMEKSAQNVPNNDLISRKAAIDAINTWDKFGVDERGRLVRWQEGLELYVHLRDVLTAIVNLPSAQADIIYCKDCKFYSPMNRETKTGICNLIMHQNFGDNWFCAGAERRPDE